MKQRLALGIALIGEPEFLVLDEPINGLDPEGIVEFRQLIKKLNTEKKVTVLISSHLLGELDQLATCYGFNGIAGNGYDMYTISMSYVLHHTLVGYVLTSVFLCGDFSNRVFGISLLSGYTRSKILLAKVIVLLIGLVCLFIEYVTLTTAVVTIGSGGFGVEINTYISRK